MGATGIPCSSPSPELPLKTDVCVKKASHLPNHQPQASFLVSSGLRIITAFVQYVLRPVVFSCPCTHAIEPPRSKKLDSKALQDGRKEVNSEVMCTLLSGVHFSTPKKKGGKAWVSVANRAGEAFESDKYYKHLICTYTAEH